LIATELHDDIGQALTALKFHIDAARRKLGTPNLPAMLDEAARIAEQTLTKLRDISLALRPAQLDDLGLVATLRWHADRQATATGTDIKFFADAGLGRLDSGLETACFRVAQEALTNIAKHAKANQVSIELIVEGDALLLAIRDDGVGFDTEAALRLAASGASLGLVSMRERATLAGGELSIESASGHGTHIQARFPLRPLI
jgi:two-component system sensor histidine kinase UhpB